MKESKYTTTSATKKLQRNGIHIEGTIITVPPQGVGLGMWSAIDFLVHNRKFSVEKVSEVTG